MTEISDKAVEAFLDAYRLAGGLHDDRVRYALSAALPHLGAAGVAVRELEWKPESRSYQTAWTSIGIVYGITEFEEIRSPFMLSSATMTDYPHFATLDAAKAAAQADFNQRIRSALVPSPVPQEAEPGEQPMATALGGDDWRIDTSAGSPILVYQDCSVIQDDQAEYVLSLIRRDQAPVPQEAEPVADWPLWCSKAANDVLTVFGYAHNISLEPGDARRDRIAKVIAAASPPSHDAELLALREALENLLDWCDGRGTGYYAARKAAEAALAPAASQEGR